jgi:hypothetical protein
LAVTATEIEPRAECRNCGAPLQGPYCHRCGQEARSSQITVRDFLVQGVEELFSVDGKFLRSMRVLLFSPGRLTREFIDGKRARYVSPLRLFLTGSVVLFAVSGLFAEAGPLAHKSEPTGSQLSAPRPAAPTAAAREVNAPEKNRRPRPGWVVKFQRWRRGESAEQPVWDTLFRWGPSIIFALVPIFAALMMVAYRRAQPYFAVHLAFAFHLHAFALFLLSLDDPIEWLFVTTTGSGTALVNAVFACGLLTILLAYGLIATRRVYGGGWASTVVKSAAVVLCHLTIATVVMVVVLVVAIARSPG